MPQRSLNQVKVFVRTRPTNNFASDALSIGRDNRTISIHRVASNNVVDNKINDWAFHIDGVFHNVSQEEIFNYVAKDVIDRTIDGYNGTVLCYGQTGAGKTHTMTGFTESYPNRGIIPRTLQHLYQQINARQEFSYTIRIAYLEIYNDQMCDLLRSLDSPTEYQQHQQQLSIGEDSGFVYVKGLSYRIANCEEEALNLLFEGETNRAVGQHVLNKQSSRSHCIFTILIECRSMLSSDEKYTTSKLNLVDLAGSERLAKTNSEGVTKREATFINKSLSFLEQVVLNLSEKKTNYSHFRSSKLTHALKDSIGGRCLTVMIANIWPETQHLEETISTLRFASRMMCVPAEPTVNEVIDPVKAIENYKRENRHLKEELAIHDKLANRQGVSYEPLTDQQLHEVENQCRRYVEGNLDEIQVKNIRQVQAAFNSFKNICRNTEKDVEKKYRDRYVLTDKHDYDHQDSQKLSTTSQSTSSVVGTAGELDGQNFALGTVPKEQRVNKEGLLKMTRNKRQAAKQTNIKDKSSPVPLKLPGAIASRNLSAEEEEQQQQQLFRPKEPSDLPETKDQRPSTPPNRTIAFEDFKQTRGLNLNKICVENKEILASKKKQYAELARRINQTKNDIDKTRDETDRKKNERMSMGEFSNESGETIIDEEEFELIAKLQELKGTYRTDYEQWKNLQSEISYCQNLLNQCQNRLLQEFDIWFNECYLNGNTNTTGVDDITSSIKSNNEYQVYDDAAERFQRMQKEILLADLDSMPFRQAQINTNRRHIYNAPAMQGLRTNTNSYRQDQPLLPPITINGNRQKPLVQ
ncbi:hypothetical protein I4U23_014598 [Adineta vaga]|nr:hypothetical protein I4U23_014598 [Adineta vaga]